MILSLVRSRSREGHVTYTRLDNRTVAFSVSAEKFALIKYKPLTVSSSSGLRVALIYDFATPYPSDLQSRLALPDLPIGGCPSLLNHLKNLLAVVAAGGLHPSNITTPLLLLLLLLLGPPRSGGAVLL